MLSRIQKLGIRLRQARMLASMSLRELARCSDVSAAFLSQVENGAVAPSERVLAIYAEWFCLDFDELNKEAGRVPVELQQHLLKTPGALKRLRRQREKKGPGDGKSETG